MVVVGISIFAYTSMNENSNSSIFSNIQFQENRDDSALVSSDDWSAARLPSEIDVDLDKVQRSTADPDGIPKSGDEYILYRYEGCSFRNIDEAMQCEIGSLKVIEINPDGECIAETIRGNYTNIGQCEGKPGEFVTAFHNPSF